jgi:hypothetical protein
MGQRMRVRQGRPHTSLGPLADSTTINTGLQAESSRVIVVLCERLAKVNSYAILAVRPATPEETKLWIEGTR